VCTFICSAAGFARHSRLNWLLRTHGSLVHYNFMADGKAILAALELKALGASHVWSFRVSDIVLTAALLAGTDPIHKLMDAFRKFMEASSGKASSKLSHQVHKDDTERPVGCG